MTRNSRWVFIVAASVAAMILIWTTRVMEVASAAFFNVILFLGDHAAEFYASVLLIIFTVWLVLRYAGPDEEEPR